MQYTKVPYYILDLLQQVPSVFVPGLGRFDAIFHPSVIDTHQSQIKPPSMGATFTIDGADDDEILPAYIHYVAGIEKSEARNQIQSFVRHLNHAGDKM